MVTQLVNGMKINTTRKSPFNKKVAVITALSALVVIGIMATYIFVFNGSIFGWPSGPVQPITSGDQQQSLQNSNEVDTQPTVQSKGQEPLPANISDLSVVFSAINQTDDTLQIRALIESIATNEGECNLVLTMNDLSIAKSASLRALASTSTCAGFDIPLSELATGTWSAELSVTSGSSKGSVNKDIVIK